MAKKKSVFSSKRAIKAVFATYPIIPLYAHRWKGQELFSLPPFATPGIWIQYSRVAPTEDILKNALLTELPIHAKQNARKKFSLDLQSPFPWCWIKLFHFILFCGPKILIRMDWKSSPAGAKTISIYCCVVRQGKRSILLQPYRKRKLLWNKVPLDTC